METYTRFFYGSWRLALTAVFCCGLMVQQGAFAAEVGDTAPDFRLTDVNGEAHRLSDYAGAYIVLEWSNPECPFVVKHYSGGAMQELQASYREQGVVWLYINSSAPGLQGHHAPDQLKALLESQGIRAAAILQDIDGSVGRLYGAQTTPHMYIINPEGVLIYAGAIDSIPSADSGDIEKAENYVRTVLDAELSGEAVEPFQTRPYGCSVKYQN